MKKTLSIHFGRQLFIIEEDAYELLQQYLDRLGLSLRNDEGASEIIEDIEMRFAELLLSYLGETRKVVNPDDIKRGISSLGEPEVIAEDEVRETEARTGSGHSDNTGQSKRLLRDPEEGMLGGVCYGVGSYLNIDPIIIRIVFVLAVFFAGTGIALYVILWILVPIAATPSDRLRMKGKPVNIDSLKEEFERAADRIKSDAKNARDRFRSGNDPYVNRAKEVVQSLVKLTGIGVLTITFLWMLFYAVFVSGFIALIPSTGDAEYLTFGQFLDIVIPGRTTNSLMWFSVLTLGITSIIMAFALGIRMITGERHKWLKPVLFVNALVFLAGIAAGTIAGVQIGRDFSVYTELEMQHFTVSGDSLSVAEYSHYSNDKRIVASGGIDFIHLKNGELSNNGVFLTYKQSRDTNFHIYQRASAHASDRAKSIRRCEGIRNICRLQGPELVVDPVVSFPATDGYRNQEVEITIEIPAGKRLLVRGVEKTIGEKSSRTEEFRVYNGRN